MKRCSFSPGSIDRAEYKWLMRYAIHSGARHVLEFGPGVSTRAFLEAGCEVWSCESEPRWFARAEAEFGGRVHLLRYENLPVIRLDLPLRCDFAWIDAPQVAARNAPSYARWNSMQAAAALCDRLLLHDAFRDRERAILKHYQTAGWHVRIHAPGPRGIAVLTRPDSTKSAPAEKNRATCPHRVGDEKTSTPGSRRSPARLLRSDAFNRKRVRTADPAELQTH